MRHRDFLTWLEPRLTKGSSAGLQAEAVHEIREVLDRMHAAGVLQPFASHLHNLVRSHATLDAPTVAQLAREVRAELAPPREKTVVLPASPERDEE